MSALKDPLSGNLDRIQIIKGWIDAQGDSHEKIFDVALSGGRELVPAGSAVEPVGNTVDVSTAKSVLTMVEAFEDDDDVQNVYHNLELTDEIAAALDE